MRLLGVRYATLEEPLMTDFSSLVPAPTGRFDGISRPYSPEEVEQ